MKAFEIDIRNETRKKHRVSILSLRKAGQKILRQLGWKRAALSVFLVGDRRIQTLNRKYLRHNRPTDVIAFSQIQGRPLVVGTSGRSKLPYLGDVVISLDTTRRQAKRYGNSFRYELIFYLCHGILHLMGYDDRTKKEASRMDRKQKRILKRLKVK